MSARPVECAGFCDLQVNGFGGVDFNAADLTPEGVDRAASAMGETGVTLFLATIITSSFEHFAACARAITAAGTTALAGIHMEGPYLSPEDGPRGAHLRAHIQPATGDDFARRQDAADGRIRLVTLAPEVPGALDLIDRLVAAGIRVALGHTAASVDTIVEAVARGATLSTHLGNGCGPTLPRHPNLLWEQLAADQLAATFIVDGHHLTPSTVKAMVRAKTHARSILVTDATAAAGQPEGDYRLGGQTVRRTASGRVTLAGLDKLAGSALTLDEAVGNVVRFAGVSVDDALAMASTQPAAAIGLVPRGRINATWDDHLARFVVRGIAV